MSSRLQLDVGKLSLRKRHLVNAYEVKAGIGVIAGITLCVIHAWAPWVYYKNERYINTFIFLSRVSTLTRDIDIGILSLRPFVTFRY